jgi:hypothetical protein
VHGGSARFEERVDFNTEFTEDAEKKDKKDEKDNAERTEAGMNKDGVNLISVNSVPSVLKTPVLCCEAFS